MDRSTYLLDNWDLVREAINEANVQTTIMNDLIYDDHTMFMNNTNRERFLTKNTTEPIIVGYNEDAKTPFMIIRFIDEKHNEQQGIRLDATSFIVITIGIVPHCGFEQMMFEYKWTKDEGTPGHKINIRSEFNVDGGKAITDYVVKIIKDEIDGIRLR